MLTRFNSFDEIKEGWLNLLSLGGVDTVFMMPQWQSIWWNEFGTGAEMLLLSLPGSDGPEGIASLMRFNGTVTLMGDVDLFDYNDILVSPGNEQRFFSAFLDYLMVEKWENLELFPLRADSPSLLYLSGMAKERGWAVEVTPQDVSPGVPLPPDWEEYLQVLSKKDRHELRRKLRRLDAVEDSNWYSCSDSATVAEAMDDFFSLLRTSRQEKHRFLTPDRERFFRGIAVEMASTGLTKLFFLDFGGQRVASALCFDCGPSRMLYNSGFDPEFSYYSVGLLLKALCIKDAINNGRHYFDFLRGDEAYKYDLGGKDQVVYKMVVRPA